MDRAVMGMRLDEGFGVPDEHVAFTVSGTPRPQPRPRFVNGSVVSTASKAARSWRSGIAAAAAETGVRFGAVGLEMAVQFRFGTPDRRKFGRRHMVRPDMDNLVKAVMDAMEKAGMIVNDKHIVGVMASKMYVPKDRAGATVIVWPADGLAMSEAMARVQ